ncbi:TipAS antibiotic-recognition domain-containing protein [Georgenia halophila]|uniref:TipAS antibiotic-recognition domain-containing protein n=1 Tax=Georgenia halophila TaxID=620889 RepID=A0ABP8KY56_9MICO
MTVSTEWSIHEITKATGTTSRTLRHYDQIGLLTPSRTGHGGLRHYDEDTLVRLQRILLLRELGLALPTIAAVLDGERDTTEALRTHLALLRQERDRVERQIASVQRTIERREGGEHLMAQEMFDGFDHTQYKDEVTRRWGADAYAAGDSWWRGLSEDQRASWQQRAKDLGADWVAAAARGADPAGDEGQALARRHVEWLRGIPGTPGYDDEPVREYILGLADMYVADPRFAANYGGEEGATFVRDALHVYADRHLPA